MGDTLLSNWGHTGVVLGVYWDEMGHTGIRLAVNWDGMQETQALDWGYTGMRLGAEWGCSGVKQWDDDRVRLEGRLGLDWSILG